MQDLFPIASELAWPFALALAWVVGEFGHRWTGLPRVSLYGLVGFVFGNIHTGLMPEAGNNEALMLLANVAFGLILFELGYRINLRWLQTNPWIAVTGVAESVVTFIVVYVVAQSFGTQPLIALLLASLAMSTSPAGLLRVINEQNSSGQVTERVLHLSALNCVLAVFAFKVIIGFGVFQSSGSLLHAIWNSLVVLVVSAGLGALFGVAIPGLLRRLGSLGRDATVAFAFAVILLVAITHAFKFSPVLAALTFGLVARYRRITLSQTQRNFGVVGDLLTVLLFFYVATTLEWDRVITGIGVALALVVARFLAKTVTVLLFARVSGISWRKGLMTGVALAPISAFVVLLLEQTRYVGIELLDQLVPLAGMVLCLEFVGPILTQRALIWANETPDKTEV